MGLRKKLDLHLPLRYFSKLLLSFCFILFAKLGPTLIK
jgi:hypothetical protein